MDAFNSTIEQLKSQKPQAIVLFGSHATGTTNQHSDVDILMIKNTRKGKMAERYAEVRSRIDTDLPMDIIVLTPTELKKYKKTNPFLRQIILNGKLLYGKI